jgi:adenine-specific DNA methylase
LVTQLDWRDALGEFLARAGSVGAVYLDPPYSKLQYSRYYHVLNVLIAYDYPPISWTGRYPPREHRFSSRFEFQPRAAEREFQDVFYRCAEAGLGLLLSYGERSFLPIDGLIKLMNTHFRKVHVFSQRVRHHSQGVRLPGPDGKVTEFVLVGKP